MLTVVTGPPAAGKSTWVRARASAADVVIDFDLLAQALAGPGADTHDHADAVRRIAHRARYAAIDEAVRHMADTDIYLIHSMPSAKHLARYRRLGARVVTVDPGRSTVEERVRALRRPGLLAVVTRWYTQREREAPTRSVTRQSSRSWYSAQSS